MKSSNDFVYPFVVDLITILFMGLVLFAASAFAGDLPDPIATPGALNPNVTQENIQTTVCVSGWTKTIRPSAYYTTKLKILQLHSEPYKSDLGASSFEEDHLISLEIGGNPTDPKNLWPQHWSEPMGAHQKDQLENYLKREVCAGRMLLAQAQKEVASDWVASYKLHGLK